MTTTDRNTARPNERKGRLLSAPVAEVFEVLGRRWALALVAVLMEGPARFSELALTVPGLSRRMMTERLRELESEGLVERIVDPGPPITSTYRLTPDGEQLRVAFAEVCSWAELRHRGRAAS